MFIDDEQITKAIRGLMTIMLILLLLAVFLASCNARACWYSVEQWTQLYFDGVNTYDCTPTAADTAPDGGTVSLPLTPYIRAQPRIGVEDVITRIKLQYRDSEGAWQTLVDYNDPVWIIQFDNHAAGFGHDVVTTGHYSKGDTALLRIWVTDGVFENADEAEDPDADGSVGNWQDQWVIEVNTRADNEKPPAPTF